MTVGVFKAAVPRMQGHLKNRDLNLGSLGLWRGSLHSGNWPGELKGFAAQNKEFKFQIETEIC